MSGMDIVIDAATVNLLKAFGTFHMCLKINIT